VGRLLAGLLRQAGHEVLAGGSRRDTDRQLPLRELAERSDIVVIAVPYLAVADLLAPLADSLAGKTVVDLTNPVNNDDWSPLPLSGAASAAEAIAELLPHSRVVKAFNTVFADVIANGLLRGGRPVTTFIAADDPEARARVAGLAADIGFDPVEVGPLRYAQYLEGMAHLNIQLALAMGGGTDAAFIYDHNAA
jgi:predicted dinucleotide-binding enzyme